MTALAADRNTEHKYTERTLSAKVAASAELFNGSMIAANLTGYAEPAAKTTGFVVLGRADQAADNSLGSDGDIRCRVSTGVFGWTNSGTNAVTQAHIGRVCYVSDDQTVCSVNEGSQVIAGIVDSIDPETDEVFVRTMDADFMGDDISATETVITGAISLYTRTSLISCTGTIAYTLAAGLYEGQRKTLICTVAASTPIGTITPATYVDGTNFVFNQVGDFMELEYHDADGWKALDQKLSYGAPETVTTGAISLLTRVSLISVTGTIAYTLADGLFVGQRKTLIVSAVASTPAGTLTPVTYVDGTTHLFQNVDEALELEWVGDTGWKKIWSVESLGAPETVTSGAVSLYTRVSLISVTGTQAYTLADGLFVGQRKILEVSVAASTPAGTLTPVTLVDGTTIYFSAVGERVELEWVGATGWKIVNYDLNHGASETVASGACSVYTRLTIMTTSGAQSYSLAVGLYTGQMKTIRCESTDNTGTITPAAVSGYATLALDAAQEFVDLYWNGVAWELLACLCTIA